MELDDTYPSMADLKRRARRRLPHFVWEYLNSGTGAEYQRRNNRAALDRIRFDTRILQGGPAPDLSVELLGRTCAVPFGVAPVGMSGLIWPGTEKALAATARTHGMPFCLSTVASQTPEDLAPHIGDAGWFQLYPPRNPDIRRDLIARARATGFHTLVLTVDLPVPSRRERQRRAGLTLPPRLTPAIMAQCALRPAWSLATLRAGRPRLKTVEAYVTPLKHAASTAHAGYSIRTSPDWAYYRALRREWDGPLVIKGVTTAQDARQLVSEGADAVWVSNHAGRQFDGGPAAIEMLPPVADAVDGAVPVLFDSGIEGGLDILRAIALGADFVMLGRGFHYAVAALGPRGANHLVDILRADLIANLGQMGIAKPTETRGLISQPRK